LGIADAERQPLSPAGQRPRGEERPETVARPDARRAPDPTFTIALSCALGSR
jgi:hypothetical protein